MAKYVVGSFERNDDRLHALGYMNSVFLMSLLRESVDAESDGDADRWATTDW